MKITLALLITFFMTFSALAEESKNYTQFDTFRFTVDNKNAKKLTKNMRSHIKKYHTKAPLQTKIYNILYGENTNELIWVMGPVNFSELEGRPDDKKHDEDWANNINPYITSYNQGELWRNMDGLVINNISKDEKSPEKYVTRYLTVNTDQEFDVIRYILTQIKDTLAKTGQMKYWAVMSNEFIQGNLNGRHLMAISSFDSWVEMDKDLEFKKHFEELYGKGSYKTFLMGYDMVFKNQWQEVITVNKEMSGI